MRWRIELNSREQEMVGQEGRQAPDYHADISSHISPPPKLSEATVSTAVICIWFSVHAMARRTMGNPRALTLHCRCTLMVLPVKYVRRYK